MRKVKSKYMDKRKNIILTQEAKKELDEVINNQINTLIVFQKKLNENDNNTIDSSEIKDTILKTEYFMFKLKSIL